METTKIVNEDDSKENGDKVKVSPAAYFFEDSIILFNRAGNPVVNNDATTYSIIQRNAEMLAEVAKSLPDDKMRLLLEWTTRIEWGEGSVILQQEIAKRGLNSGSVTDRFNL